MAILAECPICHRKQAVKNKKCKGCGEDLSKFKKSMKVRYWVDYKVPNDKAQREPVGFSIEEARAAEGKRKAQKVETPKILKRLPENRMTFKELSNWYEELPMAKAKLYHDSFKIYIANFNKVFAGTIITQISSTDIKNFQANRKDEGYSAAYIDHEVGAAKTVIYEAYNAKKVSAETVQEFKSVKKLLKAGANRRKRVLSVSEFDRLIQCLPRHITAILATGFYTGMRKGEIVKLVWSKVDLENREIRLKAEDTKDREDRTIPICNALHEIFEALPRQGDYVFTYKGKPVNDIRTGLAEGCEKAGIAYGRFKEGGFIFHDLRHTFVTMMRKAGVAASVRMMITGHATAEMDRWYDAVDKEDVVSAFTNHEQLLAAARSSSVNGLRS